MKRKIIFTAALLASQSALAGGQLGDFFKQAATKALQETANRNLQQATEKAVQQMTAPPAPAPKAAPASTPSVPAPATPAVAFASGKQTRAHFEGGTPFHPDYLVEYWSNPNAQTRGDTPSADAPGHLIATKPTFGGNLKEPGVPEMRRKLEAVMARLLEHRALKDIRGSSLSPGGGFGHDRGGPMGPAVAGSVSLNAYTIFLDSSDTIKFPDGTYHTRLLEGDTLSVAVNDDSLLFGRHPIGTWKGMTVIARGGGYMLAIANTDRPFFITNEYGQQVPNPELIDPSRPRTDIQFMTAYVGTASTTWADIARMKEKPTSGVSRLLGVLFNTDWPSLLKEVNSIR